MLWEKALILDVPPLADVLSSPILVVARKKTDMSILQLARSILVCKWYQWPRVGEKDQSFFSAGNFTLNTFLACMFCFPNRPFVSSHSHGTSCTTPPCLRAKAALGHYTNKGNCHLKVHMSSSMTVLYHENG